LRRKLAVAHAKASEDSALIAQQKLRIAKLERQIYGQRSERSSRLIDQLALTFEELEANATEDELVGERWPNQSMAAAAHLSQEARCVTRSPGRRTAVRSPLSCSPDSSVSVIARRACASDAAARITRQLADDHRTLDLAQWKMIGDDMSSLPVRENQRYHH